MNSYLFAAWVTRIEAVTNRTRRGDYKSLATLEGCSVMIVREESKEAARDRFEKGLLSHPDPTQEGSAVIRKIFSAQVIDELFTESEPVPLDWEKVYEQLLARLESSAADDCDPGYWLDVNEVVRSSASIESLRENLPEDIRSGLNWADNKQFFFLLSVVTPPQSPVDAPYEMESEVAEPQELDEPKSGEPSLLELREQQATFPQLIDMEAAAVIQARNSAVAAWIWRNYAAATSLATNAIRIDPMCAIAGPDQTSAKES